MTLNGEELARLVRSVFAPGPDDRSLAFLVDLPDRTVVDHPAWARRRELACSWWRALREEASGIGLDHVELVVYRNTHRNNAELPAEGMCCPRGELPETAEGLTGTVPFAELFTRHRLWMAPTEFSATAPLKVAARRYGFRAATMPGFSEAMVPALRLDYDEVNRRCLALAERLDAASSARIRFAVDGHEHVLELDLRHRVATASGGRMTEPGSAGNLPSGETYIVPYEGEIDGDPSRSRGELPLQIGDEVLVFRVEENRIVEVVGDGPRAREQRLEIEREPAYANLAEMGLGVLADLGVEPVGSMLLDEKLGLHIANGRSDHFPGGTVGPAHFSAPDRVVHLDHVYIPQTQDRVRVRSVDLLGAKTDPLIRDDRYC